MLNIVIFGAPGSGKGTQSERILEKYGINHISTGDVLRAEIKAETELGKTAKGFIDQGQLIPDSLMIDILAAKLDSFTDSKGVAYKEKWAAVYNPYANVAAGQQAFDWFYFDVNGEMVTGWILDGGRYYYCSPKSDGTQGRMVTEWNQIDGAWYYFNPKSDGTRGAMYVNTWIGNDYVGADGRFVPGKTR